MPEPTITFDMWKEWQPLVDGVAAIGNGDMLTNYRFGLNERGWTKLIGSNMAMLLKFASLTFAENEGGEHAVDQKGNAVHI